MPREPVLSASSAHDEEFDQGLRPQRIKDMVGQRDVIERLNIVVDAARKRGEPLGHILFDGPPGLGKTTFANCLPRELNVPLVTASGPAIKAPKDLLPFLTNMEERAIFFIDEIHRLPRVLEEHMYQAMDSLKCELIVDKGPNARHYTLNIEPFTLVGATTRAGMITAPLRDRFGVVMRLDFYTPEELCTIIHRSASILGISVSEDGAEEIARRSRGTPRIANRLLKRTRDFAQVQGKKSIDREAADFALKRLRVDERGLDEMDRRILTSIVQKFGGGPVGIQSLAVAVSEETETLEDVYEPFLIQQGFLQRTPRGRIATPLALTHLGLAGSAGKPEAEGRLF